MIAFNINNNGLIFGNILVEGRLFITSQNSQKGAQLKRYQKEYFTKTKSNFMYVNKRQN